jgi:hypothetical protein
MPSNGWNADQVKEFFEQRFLDQNRRIESIEKSVDTIERAMGSVVVKVNAMWAAVGVGAVSGISAAAKVFIGG